VSHTSPEAPTQPAKIDVTTANPARVYDYLLGGRDNFAVDRELADMGRELLPCLPRWARANRDFLVRAIGYLVEEAGIRQFIDIGSGLPTRDNVHEVAQRLDRDARVAYVDHDPVVAAHGRALLATSEKVVIVEADMRTLRRFWTIPGCAPSSISRSRWRCCWWRCCISLPTRMAHTASSARFGMRCAREAI
jgi:S-adenosyl methyltransferase